MTKNFLQCLLRVRAPVSVGYEHRCVYVCVATNSKKAKFVMVKIF